MSAFIDFLLRSGRPGGAVSLALGLLLFGLGALSRDQAALVPILLFAMGLLFAVSGGVLLVHGDPEGGDFRVKEGTPPSPELLEALNATPRPFYLCTNCRIIGEVGLCERCKKGLDCVEIRDDEDLRLALVALS